MIRGSEMMRQERLRAESGKENLETPIANINIFSDYSNTDAKCRGDNPLSNPNMISAEMMDQIKKIKMNKNSKNRPKSVGRSCRFPNKRNQGLPIPQQSNTILVATNFDN